MSELPDVLRRIVARRRQRLAVENGGGGEDGPLLDPAPRPGVEGSVVESPFLGALRCASPRAIIAEVKMGSPKLGSLAGRVDPERQAELYATAGAAALSVVVEPDFFFGSYELLERCRTACGLPTIAKDFVVHQRQLEWARDAGATAVLLIAALYSAEQLRRWAATARRLRLVPLVETHDRGDLAKLDGADWELVGVNNRDLRTFAVDLEHSIVLRSELPRSALPVAESGIRGAGDVARLAEAGFEAFLVGESLLLAEDPAALLRELCE